MTDKVWEILRDTNCSFMLRPEIELYYVNKILHDARHGAYIPMDVLRDIRTQTDWREIYKAVFAVINAENAYLMAGWDFDDIDGNDIIIHKIG